MTGIDWGSVGGTLAALGAVAGGAYAWMLKASKDRANSRADVAEADVQRTVADAQQTVYRLLNERLTTLEGEVRGLRDELATERRHSRRLEAHIWRLEGMMRKAGIDPPAFLEQPEAAAGGAP